MQKKASLSVMSPAYENLWSKLFICKICKYSINTQQFVKILYNDNKKNIQQYLRLVIYNVISS